MQLFRILKSFFTKKPYFQIQYPEYRIIPAFISGGIQYYQFEDSNALLCGRAFAATNAYKELSMSCTREFLIAHTEAMETVLRSKSIDIYKLNQLNTQLKERLEMIVDTDTPYKLASVLYFDATESPYSYDYNYANKKIARWRKENVSDFFLRQPVSNLIPSSLLSEETLENYLKIAEQINQEHLQTILTITSGSLSKEKRTSEWFKWLKSRRNII